LGLREYNHLLSYEKIGNYLNKKKE
jgi:hypothetical protein